MATEPLKSFLSFFGQNSDNLDRFLVKFHSKLNIFIIPYYFNIQVMATTIFIKSYQIAPISPQGTNDTSVNSETSVNSRDVPELRVPPNLTWCDVCINSPPSRRTSAMTPISNPAALLFFTLQIAFCNFLKGRWVYTDGEVLISW